MKKFLRVLLSAIILGGTVFCPVIRAEEASEYKKMELLIEKMMSDADPTDGSGWNQENTTKFKWSYINGCMVSAVLDLYEITGEEKYMDFADTYMSPFISDTNDSTSGYINTDTSFKYKNYTLDDINSGKALIDLISENSANNEKYKTAVAQTIYTDILGYILENQTTAEGNLWHKKVYPYQVWLDGIYMETPFWLNYELKISKDKDKFIQAAEHVTNQIEMVYAKLRDSETGLYYHGYDSQADMSSGDYAPKSAMSWAESGTGHSKSFWLRGTGWYAMALIDNIEILQQAQKEFNIDNSKYINSISAIYTDLMNSMLKYRDDSTKLWYQVVDKPYEDNYNYIETSGSAAVSYALMKGYNLGIVDKSYYEKGLEVFNSLYENKLQYSNSSQSAVNIIDICCTAGLAGPDSGQYSGTATIGPKYYSRDGSYKYYVSEKTVSNDAKGAAPMIFAYCEVLKYNSNLNNENMLIYGDVNNDKAITASDAAMLLQKTLVDTFVMDIEEVDDYMKYADVNMNGCIDADDAACVLQKALVNSYCLPCE